MEDSQWHETQCCLLTLMEKSWEDWTLWGKGSHCLLPVVIFRVSVVKAMAREGPRCTSLVPHPVLWLRKVIFSATQLGVYHWHFSSFFPAPMLTQRLHKLPSAVDLLKHFVWIRKAPLPWAVIFVLSLLTAFFSFHEHNLRACGYLTGTSTLQ